MCSHARQTRSTFCKKIKDTESVFQLLHIDVWGPMRHSTRTYCNSFITIVDDYSRFTWVFLTKHKSDFLHYFKPFYEYVLTQFNVKIKQVKTDNTKELSKGETLKFYTLKGITHQISCIDTPQQTGL